MLRQNCAFQQKQSSVILKILPLAMTLTLVSCSDQNPDSMVRIVGGQVVTDSNAKGPEFASTVAITHDGAAQQGKSYCSGTLIDAKRKLILTAAHCFEDIAPGQHHVFFGTSVSGKRTGSLLRATRVIVHPQYDHQLTVQRARYGRPSNDIAVLRFEGTIPAGFAAVALPSDGDSIPRNITLAGFGTTGALRKDPRTGRNLIDRFGMPLTQNDTGVLRRVDVALVGTYLSGKVFNVRGRDARPHGACPGDSGGPAYGRIGSSWRVFGVLSTGVVEGADTDGDGRVDVGCVGKNTYTDVRPYLAFVRQSARALAE